MNNETQTLLLVGAVAAAAIVGLLLSVQKPQPVAPVGGGQIPFGYMQQQAPGIAYAVPSPYMAQQAPGIV